MAAVAEVGIPRVSNGTKTPVAAALFAASGPATPSIAPLPNSSGCLVSFFSVAYERKVGISAPPAGMVPNGKPIAVARNHAGQERRQSDADIISEPRSFSIVSTTRLWYAAT